jgi:hypothetical protein
LLNFSSAKALALSYVFFWFHKSQQKPMVGWAEAGPFTSKGKEVSFSEAA